MEKMEMKTMKTSSAANAVERPNRSKVVEAQSVAREFLVEALPDVQRVDITKIAPLASGDATWEAEAEVWQPSPTLKSLGIKTGRPVLDHSHYLVRLDALFNILEYELRQSL
jgi:hypothetical protein